MSFGIRGDEFVASEFGALRPFDPLEYITDTIDPSGQLKVLADASFAAIGRGDFDAVLDLREQSLRILERLKPDQAAFVRTLDGSPFFGADPAQLARFEAQNAASAARASALEQAAASASTSAIQGGADVGFFDDFVSTVGGVLGGAVDIGQSVLGGISTGVQAASQVAKDIANDPIGGEILRALGVAIPDRLNNGSGGPVNGGLGMATNPSTGSPMTTEGMAAAGMTTAGVPGSLANLNPTALLTALRRLAGGPAGQIAVGVGGGLAADQALQALLGGEAQMLQQFGPPPRNPLTGRRLSSITFLDAQTGRPVVYKSQGTALLTTGDVSSARRVQRVARRAARGRRRSSPRAPVLSIQAPRNHTVCGVCLTSPCGCK